MMKKKYVGHTKNAIFTETMTTTIGKEKITKNQNPKKQNPATNKVKKPWKLRPQSDLSTDWFSVWGVFLLHFVVPMGISPMGNLGHFPQGKPATIESRYPTITKRMLALSIIHRTLTWTTGSLTGIRDYY